MDKQTKLSLDIPTTSDTNTGALDAASANPCQSRRLALKSLAVGFATTSLAASNTSVFASPATYLTEQAKAPVVQTEVQAEASAEATTEDAELRKHYALANRDITLYNTHTRESTRVSFYRDGEYDEKALNKLNLFLRDHRENEAMVMDHSLFTQMWAIAKLLDTENTFEIISGYRSPKTNEYLRSKGTGVAKFSYHMLGRAIDFRLRGVPLKEVRDTARLLNAGGVGYYHSSDFVHIDTGKIRHWG